MGPKICRGREIILQRFLGRIRQAFGSRLAESEALVLYASLLLAVFYVDETNRLTNVDLSGERSVFL